jgi:hypothetical protein
MRDIDWLAALAIREAAKKTRKLVERDIVAAFSRPTRRLPPAWYGFKTGHAGSLHVTDGLAKVRGAWSLMTLTHNLLKSCRFGAGPLDRCQAGVARA